MSTLKSAATYFQGSGFFNETGFLNALLRTPDFQSDINLMNKFASPKGLQIAMFQEINYVSKNLAAYKSSRKDENRHLMDLVAIALARRLLERPNESPTAITNIHSRDRKKGNFKS